VTNHLGTSLSLLLRKRAKIGFEPYQHYYDDFFIVLSAPYVGLQTDGNQYQYNVKDFSIYLIQPHYGPGVDSAYNGNQ
jgi:hypothetical protein